MLEPQQDVMLPSSYCIEDIKEETHDTFTLNLKGSHKNIVFSFQPGQFNMLYAFGAGEVPVSISGKPLITEPLHHTIRSVGNVTQLLSRLKPGDMIGVRGPFGSSWPINKAQGKDVIIIAGGIGLAPLRPVVYYLCHHRDKYQRVILLYGARSPEDILYAKEFKQWESQYNIEIHVTVDRATASWRGNVGVVPDIIPRLNFDSNNAIAMICGPEVMMHFSIRILKLREVHNKNIFISMERNMKCAVGFCGHCQYGPHFICKDGPVFCYEQVQNIFRVAEI